jgi:hypothetical protein
MATETKKTTQEAEFTTLQPLNINDVVSVYEGKAETCCCGCSGRHFYSPAFTKEIAEYVREGWIYQPEEFNQDKITAITELVNEHIENTGTVRFLHGNDGVTYSLGEGFYLLELRGVSYHVNTKAEYEQVRRIMTKK